MRVTAIIGVPASGKTTLMRQILSLTEYTFEFQEGLVTGSYHPREKLIVLGNYMNKEEVFAGTDKLSMAVQPEALKFIRRHAAEGDYDCLMFEGDRLSTASLFRELQRTPNVTLEIIHLKVSPEKQAERFRSRGSNQPAKFLKGRQTKIDNLVREFSTKAFALETLEEARYQANRLLEACKLPF